MTQATDFITAPVWPFRLDTLEDLRELAKSLNVNVEADEDVSILTRPVTAGTLHAPNALAIHPMEGCDGDDTGRPGKLTYRRYERFAAGGAGLIWFEAIAVVPEGRANPRQLWLNHESLPAIKDLVQRARQAAANRFGSDHRPILVAQLTHSGRYSKPQGVAHPLIPQRDPYRDAKINLPKDWPVLTDEYLDSLPDAYVSAAKLAFEAGFDAVDIKSCHGYLLNEILACHTREGKYGGCFENRVRLLLTIIDRIRAELGEKRPIVSRLGVYDAIPYPYGWAVDKGNFEVPDLGEPRKLLGLLAQRGVPMVNITVANPYYNPHYGRPFNVAAAGAYSQPEHPLIGVTRMLGLTKQLQQEFPQIALVGTGYSWLRTMLPYVGAATLKGGGAKFIGAGRMGFAYPDFPADLTKHGKLDGDKVCVACSACTQMMRDGTTAGCVVRDREVYGPIFHRGRMNNRENLALLARSCRQCQHAMCTAACPAGVDVPGFIAKFVAGDDRGAYEIIRHANIFGETCAYLCPVEAQCQGHCLQGIIGQAALPIADIQRFLTSKANKLGWSRLRLPEKATGKRIAVIGAGPAGLACAATLLELGHAVTLFDKAKSLGGTVESVIPEDRSEHSIRREIQAVFAEAPADRLTFAGGSTLSERLTLDNILAGKFDAAFIGLGLPKGIRHGQAEMEGLYDALEFLSLCKHGEGMSLAGKTVAVIGGGNTAMDAAVTALQAGARDAYLIYRRSFAEMPAWPAERNNAMDRGVHFLILTQQLEYLGQGGRVCGVKVCPTTLGDADASGRRRPIACPDNAYTLKADMIVEAIGQQIPENFQQLLGGVQFKGGLIVTDGNSQTTRQGVFAGGDIVRGASTVVAAVADGMQAARQIDARLKAV